MSKLFLLTLVASLIVLVSPANAQLQVQLNGTLSVPVGAFAATDVNNDDAGFAKAGGGFELGLKYRLGNYPVAVGIATGYQQFKQNIPNIPQIMLLGSSSTAFKIIPLVATAEYYWLNKGPLQPYAGLQWGVYLVSLHTTQDSLSNVRYTWYQSGSNQRNASFAVAPVLGLRYKLGGNLSVDFNLKYALFHFAQNTYLGGAEKVNFQSLPISLGVAYSFGKVFRGGAGIFHQ